MVEMREWIEMYEKQIESIKQGPSSFQAVETLDPTTRLSRH